MSSGVQWFLTKSPGTSLQHMSCSLRPSITAGFTTEHGAREHIRLSDEYDARLKGRPPREPYEGTLDPVSEADQRRALGFLVFAKVATIFVPVAGLAAVVVARSS